MIRRLLGFAVLAIVAVFVLKLLFGLFGLFIGLLGAILWFAFMGFLIPTVICWMVWAITMFGGFPWPVFPMIATAIPVLGATVQKKDIIESNKRRIVRKQERELRRRQRKQLPPGTATG